MTAMTMQIEAIGFVKAGRPHAEDDFRGGEQSSITLTEKFAADARQGLSEFYFVLPTQVPEQLPPQMQDVVPSQVP
jgi:hypothetical protein